MNKVFFVTVFFFSALLIGTKVGITPAFAADSNLKAVLTGAACKPYIENGHCYVDSILGVKCWGGPFRTELNMDLCKGVDDLATAIKKEQPTLNFQESGCYPYMEENQCVMNRNQYDCTDRRNRIVFSDANICTLSANLLGNSQLPVEPKSSGTTSPNNTKSSTPEQPQLLFSVTSDAAGEYGLPSGNTVTPGQTVYFHAYFYNTSKGICTPLTAGNKINVLVNSGSVSGFEMDLCKPYPYKVPASSSNLQVTASFSGNSDLAATQTEAPLALTVKEASESKSASSGQTSAKSLSAASSGSSPAVAAKPSPAPVVAVQTKTLAQIHGSHGGTIYMVNLPNKKVDIGAVVALSTTDTDSEGKVWDASNGCIPDIGVQLTFLGPDSKPRNILYNGKSVPANGVEVPNCQSYQAEVDGAGSYRLIARFAGNKAYAGSGDSVMVTIPKEGNKGTVTESKIDIPGLRQAMNSNSPEQKIKLAQIIVPQPKGNVAGVSVKQENGRTVLVPDTSNNNQITLIPRTNVVGESCNPDKILTVRFVVNKVLNDGSTVALLNDPSYPNCQAKVFTLSDLGDLSQVNRIEASVSFSDANTDYSPSQGAVTVTVSDTAVQSKPFVKVTMTPQTSSLTTYDTVTVMATTNYPVDQPEFTVVHDGQSQQQEATFSSASCSNGSGSCQYSLTLPSPLSGSYTVSFANRGVSDSVEFNPVGQVTASADEITGVGLIVNGQEVPLSLEGGQISLDLDGSPQSAFQVVIHHANGPDSYKTLIFDYEKAAEQQSTNCSDLPEGNDPISDGRTFCNEEESTIQTFMSTYHNDAAVIWRQQAQANLNAQQSGGGSPEQSKPEQQSTNCSDLPEGNNPISDGRTFCGLDQGTIDTFRSVYQNDAATQWRQQAENNLAAQRQSSGEQEAPAQPQSQACTYNEEIPECPGNYRTCHGTDEGSGCHYNSSVTPDCSGSCPQPQSQPEQQPQCHMEAEDLGTGCAQHWWVCDDGTREARDKYDINNGGACPF